MNRKGQSIIEYAVILGLVVAGLTAMQVYIKRGIQATIKVAADEIGRQQDAEEIDPQKGTKTTSEMDTITRSSRNIRLFEGGRQTIDSSSSSVSSGEATYTSTEE